MTRSPLLILGLLLAVGGVVWLLLAGDDAGESAPDAEGIERGATRPRGDAPLPSPSDPVLEPLPGAKERAEAMRRRPKWPVRSTDEIPRGDLDVRVVDGEGEPLDAAGVTVRLEREQTAFWAAPLGIYDAAEGAWRFGNLPIGRVRVEVRGAHVAATTARATVRKGRTETVTVPVEAGGSIAYSAVYYSGEKPARMKVKLHKKGQRHPSPAWFQPRGATARLAKVLTSTAEGRVEALKPGAYVLHAESEAGEVDFQEVTVRAGETAEVEIRLRK